jgi:hypothetical protein
MIREYLGKKAAGAIDRSKYGNTKVGRITSTILDDQRLEDIGYDGLNSDLGHPHLRYRMLAFAIVVNVVSWLAVFLLPSVVSKLVLVLALILPKGGILLIAPAFGFTMMGVYSLLRFWFPERNDTADVGDVMQSYAHQSDSLLTWKLWVVSCGVGGINAILLIIAYLDMTGEWKQYSQ